jgi:lysine 6-dehydrogenase
VRVVILGAGLQAQAACFDLVQQKDVTEIVVADSDPARAAALAKRWKDPRVKPVTLDVSDERAATAALKGARAALSAVPYRFNASLARAAVAAGSSFCDLGGNNDVVAAELALDAQAKAAGVTIVPDCGLAPGLVSLLLAHAVADFDRVDAAHLRVGGIPQRKGGLLDYSLVFSVEGLINEYVEDARILVDGQPKLVPSLEDCEELEFPAPFGKLEAFNTSGGTSTLPDTYKGKIPRLDYKTIRWPGHCKVMHALKALGLFSSKTIAVKGTVRGTSEVVELAPRAITSAVMGPALDRGEPDCILVRVTVKGQRAKKPATRVYQMIEYPDANGLTAMMRTTALPATVILLMLARGEVKQKGAIPQETCIDPRRFLAELEARKLKVHIQDIAS